MTPLEKVAYDIGAKGSEPTEEERLAFESWMRGHCWAVIGEWDGKQYKHAHESTGFVHGGAMETRRLWAAWRDRGAVARVLAEQAQAVEPVMYRYEHIYGHCSDEYSEKQWSPTLLEKWLETKLYTRPTPPPAGERAELIEALKRTNLYYAHGKAIGLAKRAIDMLEADAPKFDPLHYMASNKKCYDKGVADGLKKAQQVAVPAEQQAVTSSLPERDATRTAEQQGLFRKFAVQRNDGSDKPGGKHHNCEYFVLDVNHDPHSKAALQAYAASCAQSHPQLSVDLIARHGKQQVAAPYDQQALEPLYAHPTPPPTGERAKVGDSKFESWYGETKIQQMGTKQRYREAYEAGLNEAQQVAVPMTDKQIAEAYYQGACQSLRSQDKTLAFAFVRAIEAHHGIGAKP